jgi:serine/threonine-protein kinase
VAETIDPTPSERAFASLAPGVVLDGRYRLEGLIGRGGMAQVWRAEHVAIHRPVAVKFLMLSGEPSVMRARFLREARVAAAVRHRYVVDVLDFGAVNDLPYMVMELLPGRTLADRLDAGEMFSLRQTVRLCARILSGLDAVHASGIVHGDIKPENVALLVEDGSEDVPKLLDFGVSRMTRRDVTGVMRSVVPTGERAIVGTPQFMSPEQALGEPLDVRSDVFSCVSLLYLLLTARLPFEAEDPIEILRLVRAARPAPIEQLRPDLSPELCTVLKRAMALERTARFQTAAAMRTALLEAALAGLEQKRIERLDGASVPPPSEQAELLEELAEPPARPSAEVAERRRRVRLLAAISVVTLGCITLLVLLAVQIRSTPPTPRVIPLAPANVPVPAVAPAVRSAPPATPVVESPATEELERVQEPAVRGSPREPSTVSAPVRRSGPSTSPVRGGAHEGLVRDPGF